MMGTSSEEEEKKLTKVVCEIQKVLTMTDKVYPVLLTAKQWGYITGMLFRYQDDNDEEQEKQLQNDILNQIFKSLPFLAEFVRSEEYGDVMK